MSLLHLRPLVPYCKALLLLSFLLLGLFTKAAANDPLAPNQQSVNEVRFGVLALRGQQQAIDSWQPLIDLLGRQLPQYRFSLHPLGFDEIHLAVRQRQVDFVLANSAFYVELEMLYGVSPVVTMQQRIGAEGSSLFGGVIFTRADQLEIVRLQHLKGLHLAAVDRGSFGGWHAGWRELIRHGINPEKDFSQLSFEGTHDAVVHAVLNGEADAGIVRTGTLEQMVAEGKININQLHVLARKQPEQFPWLLSTQLYPEWPLAKVSGVPEDLAIQVAVTLMQMAEQPASQTRFHTRWTLPLNYQPVHDALKELKIGPYTHLRQISWQEVMHLYWHWIVIGLLLMLLSLISALYIYQINRRLQQHQHELADLNDSLEIRVIERTQRVQKLLEREHGLRGIVETVADINQIIITAQGTQPMLQAACDRLILHSDYCNAHIQLQQHLSTSILTAGMHPKLSPSAQQSHCQALIDTLLQQPKAAIQIPLESAGWGIALPLKPDAHAECFGALCVLSTRDQPFDEEEVAMLEQLSGDLGFAIQAFFQQAESERLEQQRISNYEDTLMAMVDLIEKRDTYTAGHTRRVAYYCELIGHEMGLAPERIELISRAASLHDIGKIIIPDSVLLKPGALTGLEYELIKQHAIAGYETLSNIDMYRELAEVMRHHHERLDGSGYPLGLKGDEIPLDSRIIAVADSFDAMTSDRIYKPRKSVTEALAELRSLADKHYDPGVVRAALKVLADTTPPKGAGQLPKTPLERQRFVYFFNDQLTRAYNINYLELILSTGPMPEHRFASALLLHDFSRFNEQQGWAQGDLLLQDLAVWLEQQCPDALVFRVQGDDFVILSDRAATLDTVQLKQSPLGRTGLSHDLQHFDLHAQGCDALRSILGMSSLLQETGK